MKYLFPKMPTAELNERGTTIPELVKFAKYAARTFSITEVRNQINQQNPLVIFMQNQRLSKYEWLDKECRRRFFYILNPWYRRRQVVNANGMRFWSQDNNNFIFNWLNWQHFSIQKL